MNNFLETYVEYASEVTDAPLVFHQYMAIGLIGGLLGNNVWFPFGDTSIYPNFWIVLIAPSSSHRKSTSLNIARRLLWRYNENKIYPSHFSQEQIMKNIAEQPAGVFYYGEFMTLAGLLQRDYMAGTKSFLTDAYDGVFVDRRETLKYKVKILNPAISIHAATTMDWFLNRLTESDLEGGFIPRFLIVPARNKEKDIPIPPMADTVKREFLLGKMAEFETLKGGFYLTQEAKKLYKQWYITIHSNLQIGKYSSFIQRLQIYVLKFAMCLEVNYSQTLKISEKAMKEAINYVNYVIVALEDIVENEIAFSKDEKNLLKVKNLIRKQGRITKSELLRITRLSSRGLDGILRTLLESEMIEFIRERSEGSKKMTNYYVIKV